MHVKNTNIVVCLHAIGTLRKIQDTRPTVISAENTVSGNIFFPIFFHFCLPIAGRVIQYVFVPRFSCCEFISFFNDLHRPLRDPRPSEMRSYQFAVYTLLHDNMVQIFLGQPSKHYFEVQEQ